MKEFRKILGMAQKELKHYTFMQLNSIYKDVECTKDFVFAKGDIPIMLVAHLDTVHHLPAKQIVFDRQQRLMWSPQGIGGDDRCGIYSILSIVRKGFRPYVLFTTDEEIGGVGATAFTKAYPQLPFKLKYIVELDRRGKDDCVFYDCGNDEFMRYVQSFGFKEEYGTFSDISILSPQYDVASVNLSIGYYSEHTKTETINIGHMFATMFKVIKMLKDEQSCPYFDYQEIDLGWWYQNYKSKRLGNTLQASNNTTHITQNYTYEDVFGLEELEIGECEVLKGIDI